MFANHLTSLGPTLFLDNHIDGICPENPCQQLSFSACHFLPTELSQAISHGFPSVHRIDASIPLLPNGALPKLFPTASPPSTLLSLPFLLLHNGARPKLFPTVSPPSTVSSLHVASVLLPPNGDLPKLFPTVSLRPPCRRFHLAPSQRSSLKLFPTVSPPSTVRVVACVVLLPNGARPKLFPTVSPPSTVSSLLSCSLPTELSPNYFPRFPLRPPCRRFRLAPSQRSSPQAISHGFPSAHRIDASIPLLPTELSPSYFPRLPLRPPCCRFRSCSFTTELAPSYFPRFPLRPPCRRFMSLPSCSLPTELSPNYFPQFPSVHPVVASISLPPDGALPKLFPTVSVHPLAAASVLLPSRQSNLKENPSIGDAFGKKQQQYEWKRTFGVQYFTYPQLKKPVPPAQARCRTKAVSSRSMHKEEVVTRNAPIQAT